MTYDEPARPTFFTARFQTALHCADLWHRGQTRKGTAIPYLSYGFRMISYTLRLRLRRE